MDAGDHSLSIKTALPYVTMDYNTYQTELSPTDISFDEDHRYADGLRTPTTLNSPDCQHVVFQDEDLSLQRYMTSVNEYKSTITPAPKMYTLGCLSQSNLNIAKRRGYQLNLSPFKVVNVSVLNEKCASDLAETFTNQHAFRTMERSGSWSIDSDKLPHITRSKSLGPLTPPEDTDPPSWLAQSVQLVQSSPPDSEVNGQCLEADTTAALDTANYMPRPSINMPQDDLQRESSYNPAYPIWLEKALEVASKSRLRLDGVITNPFEGFPFDKSVQYCSKEIISQVLPAHASDQRSTKTYELVCDYLDQVLPNPEFTVTHVLAVEKAGGLKDFPKSPPVTPSFSNRESYFEDDEIESGEEHQNMFTNIARVPRYHESLGGRANGTGRTQRNVMAAKADLVILERYIPPISSTEAMDFFDAESGRSYLADRLHELSLGGSLLLIYPLKSGGQTFQKKYIGPIVDPIVLEMTITRGITAAAAETIATMSAVDSMLNLEEMKDQIDKAGEVVAARSGPRLPANSFVIAHSEKAEVVLDPDTWKNWYLEQEQSRIKDDIIQYHKEGGRLPDALGRNEEITASIIAREVRDGFQKSTKETGNVPIEVGVFVIRRQRI